MDRPGLAQVVGEGGLITSDGLDYTCLLYTSDAADE